MYSTRIRGVVNVAINLGNYTHLHPILSRAICSRHIYEAPNYAISRREIMAVVRPVECAYYRKRFRPVDTNVKVRHFSMTTILIRCGTPDLAPWCGTPVRHPPGVAPDVAESGWPRFRHIGSCPRDSSSRSSESLCADWRVPSPLHSGGDSESSGRRGSGMSSSLDACI